MAKWTAASIPALTGRIAVVTGANSGLGYQTARQLARHGASVILACRDEARGTEAMRQIRLASPEAHLEVLPLDLANLSSVRQFAALFAQRHDRLDILVNNAGVMAIPRRRTADNFEMQFGTNHLGHFALTGLLLPALLAQPGARVVSVSSSVAMIGRVLFEDLQSEQRYNNWVAYAQSKLANLLFTFELDRRVRMAGVSLVAAAAHPGYASTGLQSVAPRMGNKAHMVKVTEVANKLLAQSAAQGALPLLYAATAPTVRGGDYFGPDGLLQVRGYPKRVQPPKAAQDGRVARQLWEVSEQLTGVHYGPLSAVPASDGAVGALDEH